MLVRGEDGEVYAVDENGNNAEVVGMDEDVDMGAEYEEPDDMGAFYGAEMVDLDDDDYEDLSDDDDEDDDEDEQVMGEAEDAASELEAVAQADDETFGASERRLGRRIERISDKIEKIRSRPGRGRRKMRRRARRIARLTAKRRRLREKRRETVSRRQQAIASIAGTAAGVGAAQGLGMALMSRDGVNQPMIQQASRLYDPRFAHQTRVGQTQAGLRGMYVAPPGSGRVVKLPMYAADMVNNPRNAITVPALGGISAGLDVSTEDLPYALVKLVGFVTSKFGTDSDNNAIGLVEDFRIRGGTNLFLHEGPANADDYNGRDEELSGLRHYPNIRSPNNATVTLKASGDIDDVVILTASTVVDVLEDDTYGAGFAGPYAG